MSPKRKKDEINMTTLSWVPRLNITKTIPVVPVISTSPAYTAGDQIGGIMILPDVVRVDSNTGYAQAELHSVTILDGAKQDAAIDVWFFNQSPTVGSTDNSAFAMTPANLAAQCIGAVSIGTSYSDGVTISTSTDGKNIGMNLQSLTTAATPTNLYAVAVIRSAVTYNSTSALKFLFSFYVD